MRGRLPFILLTFCILNCQDYPFEQRLPLRVQGHQVMQTVATVTPTDILFVVDNSGSMFNQRAELSRNISNFISEMAKSSDDFHVGIVTTDVECNLPNRKANCTAGVASGACCALQSSASPALVDCQETQDANNVVTWSNCDGGRLRAQKGTPAFFSRPTAADTNQWIAGVEQTISDLGCNGSSFESGFEAARRAIACALNKPECPTPSIAQLNQGFIRDNADLVIIFVTDEDDCSFMAPSTYTRVSDATNTAQQAAHLCSPLECYAYYGKNDVNSAGLQAWADPSATPPSLFACADTTNGTVARSVNPPYPDDPNAYIDYFVAAKGGDITKVRAAGIVSAMLHDGAPLGLKGDVCLNLSGAPTNACGCWSASAVLTGHPNFYCSLTASLGHFSTPSPPPSAGSAVECSSVGSGAASQNIAQGGCKGMPGGRYVSFLESLSQQRKAAALSSDTLVDSICNASYSNTMFEIVNTIILTSCFTLGQTPASAADVTVQLNGVFLQNVPVGSAEKGWSWVANSPQICLEGGLKKNIDDTFSIFIVDSVSPT